jgi:hypothetical protein
METFMYQFFCTECGAGIVALVPEDVAESDTSLPIPCMRVSPPSCGKTFTLRPSQGVRMPQA